MSATALSHRVRSSSERTYDEVWDAISRSVFPPGSILIERDLSDRYGHSRTVVREVLLRLEHEGVVERIPNRGAFVRKLTPREIVNIFSAREAVEGMAARLAALRRPDSGVAKIESELIAARPRDDATSIGDFTIVGRRLHDLIVEWSDNRSLQRAYAGLRSEAMLVRSLTQRETFFQSTPPFVLKIESASYEDHLAIVAALRARDGETAEKAMREHLVKTRRGIVRELVGLDLADD